MRFHVKVDPDPEVHHDFIELFRRLAAVGLFALIKGVFRTPSIWKSSARGVSSTLGRVYESSMANSCWSSRARVAN